MKSRKPAVAGMIAGPALMAAARIGQFIDIDNLLMITNVGVSLEIAGLVIFAVCLVVFLVRGSKPPFDLNTPQD